MSVEEDRVGPAMFGVCLANQTPRLRADRQD